ncbi:MAG: orotidine-5'-phosphate decarboxylase [Anaerolineales bacterium]|nr:orotidine-5'-phosphate decarboxylase [Anaerolineales bacterium]
MGFFSLLEERVRQADSLLCVGLDPHVEELPEPTARAALDFCLRLVEAAADQAAAFKPNAAFFELFGAQGLEALAQVIRAVPAGIPVILDAKRGDIASTARAYAQAAFQALGAQALTVNPYLGHDALAPFLEDPQRGVFLLCKTSNPGAADLQDLPVMERPESGGPGAGSSVYEVVARLAQVWNRNDNLGLVVGATHPQALARVRELAPDLWILAPGIGAQGGDLETALRAGLRSDGLGLLAPVSRGISRASDPRQAAINLRQAINRRAIDRQRETIGRRRLAVSSQPTGLPGELASLADELLEAGCVQFGQFTLKSGLQSPLYLDLRRLVGYPRLLSRVASAYRSLLKRLTFDRLAALPYAALPIATAVALQGDWPLVYPRKETKAYGTRAGVEGVYQPGERVVVIDDLATTGGSKFEAIEKLSAAGLQVSDVVVLIDRQSGAAQALTQAGYGFHAVLTLAQMLDHWERSGRVAPEHIQAARAFIASSAQPG